MNKLTKKIISLIILPVLLLGAVFYNGNYYQEVDMDFIKDGKETSYFVTAGDVEYVNSWSMKKLIINGQDYAGEYVTFLPNKIDGMYFIDYIPKNKFGHLEIVGTTDWQDTVNVDTSNTIDTTTVIMPFEINGAGQYWFCIEGIPTEINSWGIDTLLINNEEYKNNYYTTFPERINEKYYIYYKAENSWAHFEIDGSNEVYSNEIDTVYVDNSSTYSGIGKKMFIPNFEINHINSWLADSASINGVDITNKYISTLPEKIDGWYYIYFEASDIDGSINISVNDVALPVELMFLDAIISDNKVSLSWKTASETENLKFIVYRDGTCVGEIPGNGTTSEPNIYHFNDWISSDKIKITYVITNVDYSGNESKGDTVEVYNKEDIDINVYPNPTNRSMSIKIEVPKTIKTEMVIYNLAGKPVVRKSISLSAGENIIKKDINRMPTGTYILMLNNEYTKVFSVLK